MDVVKKFDQNALFCISKSSNNHILYFTYKEGKVEVGWILRHEGEEDVQKGVDVFSQSLLGIHLEEEGSQLKICSAIQVPIPNDLYLVDVNGTLKIMFDKTKVLHEIFVDMETEMAYCKCYDYKTKSDFVLTQKAELGVLGNLF